MKKLKEKESECLILGKLAYGEEIKNLEGIKRKLGIKKPEEKN